MINNDYSQSNNSQTPANSIPSNSSIAKNNGGFYCTLEDSKIIYHWIDTAIEQLSSSKLWDILRLAKIPSCGIDKEFSKQVINELKRRKHYDKNRPWMKPH